MTTGAPVWSMTVIEPFLRLASIVPSSTCLRQFHRLRSLSTPRLSTMFAHFTCPANRCGIGLPFDPAAVCSMTWFSVDKPLISAKKLALSTPSSFSWKMKLPTGDWTVSAMG